MCSGVKHILCFGDEHLQFVFVHILFDKLYRIPVSVADGGGAERGAMSCFGEHAR